MGGSAGETTETDQDVTSGAMSEVEDNPPLPKNEQKLSPRSQERSETTSDVQSMVRSAAETFGSVGSALISSLQSQHKEVLKELRGEKKGKKIPLPELKMQDSGEKPTVLQTAAFLQEVAVLRSSHYKGVGSMIKMVVRRPNGMKQYHRQELGSHLDETDEELLAMELGVSLYFAKFFARFGQAAKREIRRNLRAIWGQVRYLGTEGGGSHGCVLT